MQENCKRIPSPRVPPRREASFRKAKDKNAWIRPQKKGTNRTVFLPGPDPAQTPLFFSICDREKQLPPPEAWRQADRQVEEERVGLGGGGGGWWLAGGMVHGV